MFIRTSVRARLALAAALALLSSACTDQLPTARAVPPPTGETVRAGIACTVAVAAGEVRCDALSGGGGSRNVILGGQNKYVRLASTDLAYDSVAGVFQMNVTVQSLLGQPMGTPDGTTATGVRVFFERLPAATSGTGEVTVNNADSVGAFTRLDQPYFEYPEILEPYGASRPRVWRFNVPKTVAAFSFAVYIDTELPAEQGALRWTHEWGYGTRVWTPFDAIWGASRGHVHAVAGRWILGLDSAGWSLRARAPGELYDVWGASRYEVYAAGDSGVVMRFDGNRWQTRRAPTAPHQLSGLWTDGGDLWAVGRRRDVPGGDVDGLILRSADDGQTWAETLSPGAGKRYLRDVFRVDGSVYVVGFEDPLVTGASPRKGVLLRSRDGGATWSDSLFSSPSGITFFSVWADGPDDVYIGGELLEAPRVRKTILMHSTDGGATWTTAPSIPGDVQNLWRVPGGRLYAAGSGGILVNDGGTWSQFEGGCVSLGAGWMGVWGSAENDLHAVANPDFAWRYDGTCWRSTSVQRGGVEAWAERLNAVAAQGNFAVAAGTTPAFDGEGQYLHNRGVLLVSYAGSDWTPEYTPSFSSSLEDVWTAGTGLSVAAGWRQGADSVRRGLLLRRSAGGGWGDVTPAVAADVPLSAVWGAGGEVRAFGVRDGAAPSLVIYRSTDGAGTWSETSVPYTGAGTPQVTDAWGSATGAVYVSGYGRIVAGADTTYESFTLRYHGTAWVLSVGAGDGAQLTGVWSAGTSVFVSGHREAGASLWNGFVRRSDDGGETWVETVLSRHGADGRVEGIWGASTSALYAVGGGGVVHVWDGGEWTAVLGLDRPALFGVGGTTAGDVYAVGASGAIYHGTR